MAAEEQELSPKRTRPRPAPLLTDRRSLNRAKPPPVYLEREEGVTPGVWPSAKYQKMKPPVTKTPKIPKVAAAVKAAEEPAKMKAKSSALRTRRVVSEEQPPRAVVSRVSELAKFRAAKEAKVPVQQTPAARAQNAGALRVGPRTLTNVDGSSTTVNPRELAGSGYKGQRHNKHFRPRSYAGNHGAAASEPEPLSHQRSLDVHASSSKGKVTLPSIKHPSQSAAAASSSSPDNSTKLFHPREGAARIPSHVRAPAPTAKKKNLALSGFAY